MRIWPLCLLLVGCGTHNYYRYVVVPEAPAAALDALDARARDAAMQPRRRGAALLEYTFDVDQKALPGMTQSAAPDGSDVEPPKPGKMRVAVQARVAPEGTGTRIELAAATRSLLDRLETGGRTYRAIDAATFDDPVHWELTIDGGAAGWPGGGTGWRADVMARIGNRLWTRGGGGIDAAPRLRLSVLGGAGFVIEVDPSNEAGRVAFRPEFALSLDRQATASPMAGTVIPQGRRFAVDLSLAALLGAADRGDGAELGVAFHIPPYGGVFARVGYEWGEVSGRTYVAGLRLDTLPAAVGCAVTLLGGLVLAATQSDWNWDWLYGSHQ